MRYYAITIGGSVGGQWSTIVNGQNDPGALNIEFDITDMPNGQLSKGWLKIYGITPYTISQSVYYTGSQIQLYAGFSPGLFLANQQVPHAGKIMDGQIWPCWGNWVGNELSIEFSVILGGNMGPGGPTNPINIIHNMQPGQTLASAIKNTLSTAFPGSNIAVNISQNLKLNYPDYSFHQGLEQYADYIKKLSHDLMGTPSTTGYQGVRISAQGTNMNVGDGTILGNVVPIQYYDLVGQPTWIGANEVQIRTLLRSDIVTIGNSGTTQVTLPQNTLMNIAGSGQNSFIPGAPQWAVQSGINALNFQGTFIVTSVRHIGNFRQPTGEAWITLINCTPNFSAAQYDAGAVIGGQQIFNSIGQQ
jgi:hypothetical protein